VLLASLVGAAPFNDSSPFHAAAIRNPAGYGDGVPTSQGNRVAIINDGYEALLLRVHLIRNAERTIDFQSYIWGKDETSLYLREELYKAARRGVRVRLLLDHLAMEKDPEQLALDTRSSENFSVRVYRPILNHVNPPMPIRALNAVLPTGTNQRMHLKQIIVDGAVGITGGRNVENHYFDYATTYNFKDRDALVVGPAVRDMTATFDRYWNFRKTKDSYKLRDVKRALEKGVTEAPYEVPDPYGYFEQLNLQADDVDLIARTFVDKLLPVDRAQFVADKPGNKTGWFYLARGGGPVTGVINDFIKNTEDEILIQSPYVVVGRRSKRTFKKLRKRRPDVRIRVSTNSFGAADHLITYAANYRLRPVTVDRLGFEIYEYKPHPADLEAHLGNFKILQERADAAGEDRPPYLSLHSKTFVFDGDVAFVGSVNLDPRSFFVNSEGGLILEGSKIVAAVREDVLRDMAAENAWVIAKVDGALTPVNRILETISTISPVDIWPLRNTSSFQLRDGMDPVSPGHPEFYDRYEDIGSFPGVDTLSPEEVVARFYKITGKIVTPLL
jgi:phosphatidylserine/phosphatidylglycerophosphate/cardiolipin synthase-like enzyme